jgi:hypothetical protein
MAPCSRNMLWQNECNIYTQRIGCEKGTSVYYILLVLAILLRNILRFEHVTFWAGNNLDQAEVRV